MRRLTPEETKKVQLEIVQEFHDFCISNGIKYSLCAGTLLGAIRHQGYIPWDDDIDVMMPRGEYDKLLQSYKSDKYKLYTYDSSSSYIFPYAKLSDVRTIKIENSVYHSDYGVDIDIFPLDFFPDTIAESKKWSRRLGYWKDILAIKNIKLSSDRLFYKNCIIAISRFFLYPIPMKYVVRKVDVLARKYSYKKDGFWGNMTNGYRMKERNPMASLLIDVCFEGKMLKAVSNYDVYLRGLFGDYMQLPPIEKRVSHHDFEVFWK